MDSNGNTESKEQIRRFIENAIKKARDPDPREKVKRERSLRMKKVSQKYGF